MSRTSCSSNFQSGVPYVLCVLEPSCAGGLLKPCVHHLPDAVQEFPFAVYFLTSCGFGEAAYERAQCVLFGVGVPCSNGFFQVEI